MASQRRLLGLVAFSIFISELALMAVLPLFDPLPVWLSALIDAFLLLILISPVLYFGLFRVLIRHTEGCRRIEEDLKRELSVNAALSSELEQRVAERTERLVRANEILKMGIRERRLVQQRLQQIKSDLQAIFDAISDPLVLMGDDLTVKMINRSAALYYGLDDGRNIVGTRCHERLMESAAPCAGCKVPEGIASGGSVMFERRGFIEKERLEQVFLYPVAREDDRGGDILMRISDVTEERILERQLIHSEKLASLGVLVSSVAHEISNPNSFIGFNIPILRDYIRGMMPIIDTHAAAHPDFEIGNMPYPDFRKDIQALLDNVEHGAKRISTFVSNLKNFSRFKAEIQEESIDLRQVVEHVTAICRARLKKDVAAFTIDMPENLPRIWSDADAIEQVVLNLLINAAQSVDKPASRVRLSVAIQDAWADHVVIEIEDNGCGMDAETRRRIFDPFFSTKSGQGGVGLGLYVCQSLVEGLRGRIEVESRPGQGSTFRVILPDRERRRQKRL
jgi:C4-dicarboxylate-specific signal transduction histidine kinase